MEIKDNQKAFWVSNTIVYKVWAENEEQAIEFAKTYEENPMADLAVKVKNQEWEADEEF